MMRFGLLSSVLLGFGLLGMWVAERVLDASGSAHTIVFWAAVLLVALACAGRAVDLRSARGDARRVELWLSLATGGVVLSLLVYGLSTEPALAWMGLEGEAAERPGALLEVAWPALLAVSLGALVFMEAAYRKMPIAEAVELRRVREAAGDGLAIALALVFVVSINYVARKRDVREDLSFFRTAMPSESTLAMVRRLGTPVEVVLFYPTANEVLDQLRPYFEAVDAASDKLTVKVRDHALAPALTRQHRIRGNGHVALLSGQGDAQRAETFQVGLELQEARRTLRTLDGHFQRAYARLVQVRREVHVTVGHDERSSSGIEGDGPGMRTRELTAALERSNITTRPLGMAQGLANRVPEGAPAVMVVGPRRPFAPEEASSLLRYVQHGGRLFAMVDPDVDHGLEPLLSGLGLRLERGVLTSERYHVARTRERSDRQLVYTKQYTSHPTVTLASRFSNEVATILVRGGALSRFENPAQLQGIQVQFPIRTPPEVWLDRDGDYEKDGDETETAYNVMAVVTVPRPQGEQGEEGRAVILADGDFVTDQVIRNPGNGLVLSDVFQWLLGEEQVVAETTTEEDVPIEHTQEGDAIWFYGTTFGVPLPVLGVGIWAAWRRRRRAAPDVKRGAEKKEPAPVSPSTSDPGASRADPAHDPASQGASRKEGTP
ncbi:MAG: GldG family protein [Myxococcota bacterium]|nr:GldG family protein [Myxococcota bacterium]